MSDELLPPPIARHTSRVGWIAFGISVVIGLVLSYTGPWPLSVLYLIVILIGMVIGMPGAAQYQAEIEAYLDQHPGLRPDQLAWPHDYAELGARQLWSYRLRGVPDAIQYGVLTPIVIVIAVLGNTGIVKDDLIDRLYR